MAAPKKPASKKRQAAPLLPVDEVSRPDAKKQPLLALKYILFSYLSLGGPAGLGIPLDFIPLAHMSDYITYFRSDGYVATLLCMLLPLFLAMTDRQVACKKRAAGGKCFANPFTFADLKQEPANLKELRRTSANDLFLKLRDELRLLFRLLHAARLAYRLAPDARDWLPIHRAAMIVLLRLAQISAALRRKATSHAFAEECFRYQARIVWDELFAGEPLCEERAPGWSRYRRSAPTTSSPSHTVSGANVTPGDPSPRPLWDGSWDRKGEWEG